MTENDSRAGFFTRQSPHIESIRPAELFFKSNADLFSASLAAALMTALLQCLAEGGSDACSLWQNHLAAFSAILPVSTVGQLNHAFDQFDFDAALTLLQGAQAKPSSSGNNTP